MTDELADLKRRVVQIEQVLLSVLAPPEGDEDEGELERGHQEFVERVRAERGRP